MKITCGSCSAKYTVSDEKVQGKTVKIKCRKCGAVIVVSSTGEVQTTGGEGGAAAELGDGAFTVSVTDTDQRNMSMPEIVNAYNEGTIDAETFVWADGMDDWMPLKDVDSIVDALHEAAAAEADPGGEDLGATMAMADAPMGGDPSAADALGSLAAGGAAVAATAPGGPVFDAGGGSAQSFGQADGSPDFGGSPDYGGSPDFGSTVALSSSPEEAAPAPAAGGGGFFEMAGSSASLNPGPADGSTPAAGGEENSAIFSLSMLTQKVGNEPEGGDASTTEDSGLIDLKALAAGVGSQEPAAAPAVSASTGDGVFPLGAPAPAPAPAAPAVTPSMAPEGQKSGGNRGLVIGLAAAVVVLGAALLFFVVKGDDPKTTADGTTAQPNYTAPPAEPKAEPEPEESAEPVAVADPAPSASASASASAEPSSKVAAAPNPNYRPPPPGTQPPPTTVRKKKKAAPPPSAPRGPCGCAADDLMCNMRCARKKKKK